MPTSNVYMHWIYKDELSKMDRVDDFNELLQVILDDKLTEFQYVIEDGKWNVILK